MAARRVKGFVYRNPNVSAFAAGSAAQGAYSATRKRKRKTAITSRRKMPRKAGGGKPPATPSARVSAKYAVADRMTKFKKAKVTAQKVPKSAIVHYKEFGQFNAEKCMYINHEHWGSLDKLWYGIALGLAKKLLPMAKIYNGKSLEDPCIGPRTDVDDPLQQFDDKDNASRLRLVYVTEALDGVTTRSDDQISIEDISTSPDKYLSMDAIANAIATSLKAKYSASGLHEAKTYLQEASIVFRSTGDSRGVNIAPVYIQNLDDAEICLYVNSLLKFQNVTPADHATTGTGMDKGAIDANPLQGRVYTAKGHYPMIDGDLSQMGDKSLDAFFGDHGSSSRGITVLGSQNNHTANDLGRISSIPPARELYGNQTVASGTITMPAGAMKFHKTSFTFRHTFKSMAGKFLIDDRSAARSNFGRHTLFGVTPMHKHGEDSIKIGYNRETDVGCYIKHKRIVYPLKTNYTDDYGTTNVSVAPTEHTGA